MIFMKNITVAVLACAGAAGAMGLVKSLATEPPKVASYDDGTEAEASHHGGHAPAEMPRSQSPSSRKILYYKNPMGEPDTSPVPKKDWMGMDYIPVYEDEAASGASSQASTPSASQGAGAATQTSSTERKLLYYRNPMGLPDTSPTPKKDWMGMDYIPVYEGDEPQGSGDFKISLDKIQRSGVRSEVVTKRPLPRSIRAPGLAKINERTLRTISLRADAFIEKLYANETGQQVKAGEPLFRLYSQAMVNAQVDLRTAELPTMRVIPQGGGPLQRLRNLDIPENVLASMQGRSEPLISIDWPSPVSGVVLEKKVIEGQMARMGEELLRIGDLSTMWIIADVSEQDLALVKTGLAAKVSFRGLPGRTFEGVVTFVLYSLDAATRTAKVRIEVANPDLAIRQEMYADVDIAVGDDAPKVAVPASAVLDSGNRQIVLIDKGQGRFEPRPVRLGLRTSDFVEVQDGVAEGEMVVVSATFLIDAESNFKSAVGSFSPEAPK